VEGVELGSDDVGAIVWTAILTRIRSGVAGVAPCARVFMDGMLIRNGVEAGCVDHATRNAASEFLYLFANIEEEGIGAPATN